MYQYVLTTLSIITVIIMVTSHRFLSKGQLKFVYPLNIIGFSLYLVIETMLALHDPSQWAVLLFNITNLIGLISAIQGYYRLNNENI